MFQLRFIIKTGLTFGHIHNSPLFHIKIGGKLHKPRANI